MKTNNIIYTSIAASILLLSGCGSDDIEAIAEDVLNATTNITISGKAVDGYIKDAQVCIDTNKDDVCGANEPTTTTDENGDFTLSSIVEGEFPILINGGVDTATDKPFIGQLKSIVDIKDEISSQTTNITPLTTMVAYTRELNPNLSEEDAVAIVATNFGLTPEQIDADPLKDKDLFEKSQKIMLSAQVLAEAIPAQTEQEKQDKFNLVLNSMASTLKEGEVGDGVDIDKVAQALNDKEISIDNDTLQNAKEIQATIQQKVEAAKDDADLNALQAEVQNTITTTLQETSNSELSVDTGFTQEYLNSRVFYAYHLEF
jgi:hypothetical protein